MRIRSVVYTRHRKKKYFRLAKGYYSNKKNRWRQVKQQVEKSLSHAYQGRKNKKRFFRQRQILLINALCRQSRLPYSRFINGLRKAEVAIDRKMLCELITKDKEAFQQLTNLAKTCLGIT